MERRSTFPAMEGADEMGGITVAQLPGDGRDGEPAPGEALPRLHLPPLIDQNLETQAERGETPLQRARRQTEATRGIDQRQRAGKRRGGDDPFQRRDQRGVVVPLIQHDQRRGPVELRPCGPEQRVWAVEPCRVETDDEPLAVAEGDICGQCVLIGANRRTRLVRQAHAQRAGLGTGEGAQGPDHETGDPVIEHGAMAGIAVLETVTPERPSAVFIKLETHPALKGRHMPGMGGEAFAQRAAGEQRPPGETQSRRLRAGGEGETQRRRARPPRSLVQHGRDLATRDDILAIKGSRYAGPVQQWRKFQALRLRDLRQHVQQRQTDRVPVPHLR